MELNKTTYERVHERSLIDDEATYAVMATYKDEKVTPFIKFKGTYDDCADYAERNESPDNNECYYVAKEVNR